MCVLDYCLVKQLHAITKENLFDDTRVLSQLEQISRP